MSDDLHLVGCLDVSAEALGDLHYSAYQLPDRAETREAARAEMRATLGGKYGQLLAEASPVLARQGQPLSVVQTVVRAPWDDVGDGPFVIELFTAQDCRGQGWVATCSHAPCPLRRMQEKLGSGFGSTATTSAQ
jgi:hypothetical protein